LIFSGWTATTIDMHGLRLLQRKRALGKTIPRRPSRILHVEHIEHRGAALFKRAREFVLDAIVAKWKDGRYRADQRLSAWVKIKNPKCSQAEGGGTVRTALFRTLFMLVLPLQDHRNPHNYFEAAHQECAPSTSFS